MYDFQLSELFSSGNPLPYTHTLVCVIFRMWAPHTTHACEGPWEEVHHRADKEAPVAAGRWCAPHHTGLCSLGPEGRSSGRVQWAGAPTNGDTWHGEKEDHRGRRNVAKPKSATITTTCPPGSDVYRRPILFASLVAAVSTSLSTSLSSSLALSSFQILSQPASVIVSPDGLVHQPRGYSGDEFKFWFSFISNHRHPRWFIS